MRLSAGDISDDVPLFDGWPAVLAEISVVDAVQPATGPLAPTQVSRSTIWRSVPVTPGKQASELNATNRPSALMTGNMEPSPNAGGTHCVPAGFSDTRRVDGVHDAGAPTQVSRR